MEQRMNGISKDKISRMHKAQASRLIIGYLLLLFTVMLGAGGLRCLAAPAGFTIESGVLTAYTGSDKAVVVPDSVTEIGTSAFAGNEDIVSVSLPSTVKVIGKSAFSGCSSLTFVNMPTSLTTIGAEAFLKCSNLTEVVMPNTVTTMGEKAFKDCTKLASVKLSTNLKTIETSAFDSCSSLLYVTVPSGVTTIKEHAFYVCKRLLGISLPNSVTTIERGAFAGCSHLLNMQLPSGVTKISDAMFAEEFRFRDDNLYALFIPSGVTSIGRYALPDIDAENENSNLQTIYFGGSKSQWEAITLSSEETVTKQALEKAKIVYNAAKIPDDEKLSVTIPSGFAKIGTKDINGTNGFTVVDGVLISYNGTAKTITVPDGVTYINPEVFKGNENLTKVTLPSSLYGIGDSAFESCTNLKTVVIDDSTCLIGKKAFSGCSNLESVNLPSGLFVLEDSVFYNCEKLQSITLPQSLVFIGTGALELSGLTELTIPDQVLHLGNGALEDCDALITCNISANVRSIGDLAFDNCNKLQTVNIPTDSKMKKICRGTFSNCYHLTGLKLPKGIQKLNFDTFNFCEDMMDLEIPSGMKRIGKLAFASSGITKLVLPEGLKEIDDNAFAKAYDITVISLPKTVTKLGDKVFDNCRKLKTVFIPGGVDQIGENSFTNCNSLENIYFQGTEAEWKSKGGPAALAKAPTVNGSKPKVTFKADPSALSSLIVYRIYYDLQGGMPNSLNPDTYTLADPDITLKDVEKDGHYNFLGWICPGEWTTPKKEVTIQCSKGSDKHFTAMWERYYRIEYKMNGGSDPSKKTYTENEPDDFYLETPTRSGYAFLGWTGSNGTVPQKSVKVVISQGGDRSYEAHWAKMHSIKYVLDGGKAPSGSYPASYTEADPDLTIADPVKEGTEFLGWILENDTVNLVKDFVLPHGSTDDFKLTAVWKGGKYDKEVYSITYNLDGGTMEGNPDSYTSDDPDILIKMPKKENFYFMGWETSGASLKGTPWEPIIPHGCRGDLKFKAHFLECDHEVKSILPQKEPTCTEPGYKEGTCCACGKISYPGEAIPALGHSWDEGQIIKQPTATEAGVMVYTCTRCGAKDEVVLSAGSKPEDWPVHGGQGGSGGQTEGGGQTGPGGQTLPGGQGSQIVSGNSTISGNAADIWEDGIPGKVGNTFVKGKGVYRITKRGKKPEVMFLRPYGKKRASAVIPAKVKYKGVTYKVTAIGPKAFSKWKKKLKKVTIGKNVRKIGKAAFKGCRKLRTIVNKSKKLKKKNIAKNAFANIYAKAVWKMPNK